MLEFLNLFLGLCVQDGFLRVILDGGPSRVFSLADAKLLEEDLEVLKVRDSTGNFDRNGAKVVFGYYKEHIYALTCLTKPFCIETLFSLMHIHMGYIRK